ncbi:LytR/AlgR family response regulator transcription factor [Labilibacter marinus]|uniref:LytR/AlgR family response regulator transcription factor n=1 Tax=Labilibacter marinus TaxID=1477105 RepID=UPI0008361A3C|nr:LytTR family DNA-binding domain-containing protein [Labilibacter marinus]
MNPFKNKILLSNHDAYHIVNFEDILYCKSNNSSTIFFLINGQRISTSLPIGCIEERLSKYSFIRSHQSYIVNAMHILSVRKNQHVEIELINHSVLPVSTRRKATLMQFISKMERIQST